MSADAVGKTGDRAWGDELRARREAEGLTILELGQLVRVTFTTVSAWERGAHGISAEKHAELLALLPGLSRPVIVKDHPGGYTQVVPDCGARNWDSRQRRGRGPRGCAQVAAGIICFVRHFNPEAP